jgi:hypothetical protein
MADAPEILLDSENVGEGGEELIADWKKFTEQLGIELSDIVKAIAYDDSGDKGYWGQVVLSKERAGSFMTGEQLSHYLWLYEEESCNLESPVELIHQFFKRWRPTEYLVLSWAETCSKMRVDEFGGGECLITGDWVYWPPRHLHNMAVIYADAKQAGKTMTAEEALAIIEERMEP